MKKKLFTSMIIALASIASAQLEIGDVIFIESQSTTGDGTAQAIRADGNTWNQANIGAAVAGNLLLADGSDEGVTMTFTNGVATIKLNGPTGFTNLSWVASDVQVQNFFYDADDLIIEFKIEGLSSNFTYNVRAATGGNSATYNSQDVTVNGVAGLNSTAYDSFANASSSTPIDMSWDNAELDASGDLVIKMDGTAYRATSGIYMIEVAGSATVKGTTVILL